MNKFSTDQDHTRDLVHHNWSSRRKINYGIVKNWCDKNQVEFQTHKALWSLLKSRHTKLVYMLLWDMIPNLSTWQQLDIELQTKGKFLWVITDNFVELPKFSNIEFVSCPELLGIISWDHNEPIADQPSRKFTCLMQRADSVRQSWLYLLHNFDLINRGNVSYLCRQLADFSEHSDQDLFDYIHTNFDLAKNKNFDLAYHQLRSHMPFRNFDPELSILDLIRQSEYNLILETYATVDDQHIWSFTEKSLRELQFATTSLIFCQKHGLSKLKSLGLEFASDLMELDEYEWPIRQTKLIDGLLHDQFAQTPDKKLEQAQHNRHVLHVLLDKIQKPDYFDTIFQMIAEK